MRWRADDVSGAIDQSRSEMGGKRRHARFSRVEKEHLLVSKVLPIFGTSYYFCACSNVSLLYEAYDLSSQSEA